MKAAIFDLDGTLINSLIFWDEFWQAVGEKYLQDPTFRPGEEIDRACRTLTLADAMELVHERCGVAENGDTLAQLASQMIVSLYRDRVETKVGVMEFLQHLRQRGVKMAIATASNGEYVKLAMERCGLNEYFEHVVSCATVGKGKEHPDVFLLTLDLMGAKPEESWMFEDSFVALQTARRIGMHTVGIYDRNNFGQDILRENSDHYIADGESLTRLIGLI